MKRIFPSLSTLFIGILLLTCTISVHAQLTITANQTATTLAQKLAGNGITILNANLVCAGVANGSFVTQTSNLGLDSGIVLTTGHAAAVAGSEPGVTSYNNNTAGDIALQNLSGASVTRDACILQFDLVPKGDTVKFDYVFGSEEYINSVCGSYNDAFAFFISGPGIAGTHNMAQILGTNIPVAVNSINSGIPSVPGNIGNCTSMGAGSPFTSYYINNTGGATIAYRGFTTVLTAAHSVNPCDTYHLKLTIADALNGLYDSGVFIKAGSLQSSTFSVIAQGPVGGATPAIYKGCSPGSFTFSRSAPKPTPQILTYQISGTAVNGIDYVSIPSTITIPANASSVVLPVNALMTPPSGLKNLKILLNAAFNCNGAIQVIDSASLDILDTPSLDLLTQDTVICKGDHMDIVTNGSAGLTYRWSPVGGLNNPASGIPLATPFENTVYSLKAFIAGGGCDTLSGAISIEVRPRPSFVDAGVNIDICNHTPILIDPIISPDDNSFTYEWSMPGNSVSPEKELSIPNPLVEQSGIYYFTVNSGVCGTITDSVAVNIVDMPLAPQVVSPLKFCLNEPMKTLPVTGKNLRWYKDAEGEAQLESFPMINTSRESTQDFYVSQSFGTCESERVKFTVIVERCCDDFIFVPSVFTPNGDGNNDVFEVQINAGSRLDRIEIFNRWGQMVYQGNSSWNGTQNGRSADLGNYFYNISFTCKDGKIIHKKGEVLLVK